MVDESQNAIITMLKRSVKTPKVFLFPPLRAAWPRKVAFGSWTFQQPSRPFS